MSFQLGKTGTGAFELIQKNFEKPAAGGKFEVFSCFLVENHRK